jgi:hypothetical protein
MLLQMELEMHLDGNLSIILFFLINPPISKERDPDNPVFGRVVRAIQALLFI